MAVIIPCKLKLSGAKVPCRMSSGAVGFDLWGAKLTRRNGVYCFDTGVEMELPVGFAGLLVARSSVVCSGLEMMGSGVQVIDPDYRGTVKVLFRKSDSVQARGAASLLRKPTVAYYEGQRVAQLIIVPTIMAPAFVVADINKGLSIDVEFAVVEELSHTYRETKGFGSTGGD